MSEQDKLDYIYEDDGPNCLIGSHGVLFARVQQTPEHNAVEYARKFAACDDLVALARAYEAFEAELILANDAWGDSLPRFTQELYDRWMEIQKMRNAALKKAVGE